MPPARIGRYDIVSTISHGGMGSVFLARDPELHRQVAIKLLLDRLDTDEWRHRFRREAKALARLDHPNVVAIFDVGEDEGGRPFLVMEYVRGRHLGELIGTPLPLAQKLRLLEQLCDGLECAHQAGLAHLDVKPANLIVDGSSRLRVVDFGIARRLDGTPTRATVPDVQSGTPSYMAPEQVLAEAVGPPADQFAVGAVAYELLSGQRAFEGTLREVLARIVAADPPPLTQTCPGIDPALDAIVRRALGKHPQQRFPSMAEMGRALADRRASLDSHGVVTVTAVAAPPVPGLPAASQATTVTSLPPGMVTASRPGGEPLAVPQAAPRRRWPWLVASVAAVAVAIAAFAYSRPARSTAPAGDVAASPAPEVPGSEKGPADGGTAPGLARNLGAAARPRDAARSDGPGTRVLEQIAALFASGDRQVLVAIEDALRQHPGDPTLQTWLGRVEARAHERTDARRQAVVVEGATSAPTFERAVQSQRDAQDLRQRGTPTASAVRKLWEAEELFATALEWKADTAPGPRPADAGGAAALPARAPAETEAAVRASLAGLSGAYAAMSAAAVKLQYPGLTADEARALDRGFLEYEAYRLDVRVIAVTAQGSRAVARCALDSQATLRSGETRRATTAATFTLEQTGGRWVIVGASRLPN